MTEPIIQTHVEELVTFSSGKFALEGILAYPESGLCATSVLVASPHPSLGGNMENNVVRALSCGLAQRGHMTLRFNYRGVGRSEGRVSVLDRIKDFRKSPHIPLDGGEDLADVLAAREFLLGCAPHASSIHLTGYSYGAALLLYAHFHRPSLSEQGDSFLVSPPLSHCETEILANPISNCSIVIAEKDVATDAGDLLTLPWLNLENRSVVAATDHFYLGGEEHLVAAAALFLRRLVSSHQ